jgi:hypothetical protein
MTMSNGIGLPFSSLLETMPEAAYYSRPEMFGTSPRQRRYFQNQFRDIHNQYLGQLGKQLRAGTMPSLRFSEFLDYPNLFNEQPDFLRRQYMSETPSARGATTQRFAPPTRFMF